MVLTKFILPPPLHVVISLWEDWTSANSCLSMVSSQVSKSHLISPLTEVSEVGAGCSGTAALTKICLNTSGCKSGFDSTCIPWHMVPTTSTQALWFVDGYLINCPKRETKWRNFTCHHEADVTVFPFHL